MIKEIKKGNSLNMQTKVVTKKPKSPIQPKTESEMEAEHFVSIRKRTLRRFAHATPKRFTKEAELVVINKKTGHHTTFPGFFHRTRGPGMFAIVDRAETARFQQMYDLQGVVQERHVRDMCVDCRTAFLEYLRTHKGKLHSRLERLLGLYDHDRTFHYDLIALTEGRRIVFVYRRHKLRRIVFVSPHGHSPSI
jgi:hypothetical protein